MKLKAFTPLLLILVLLFTSCSPESIGYQKHIIDVYFNPSNPEQLVVSTSTLNNDSDYIINNDGSEGYLVTMIETDTDITFEFITDEHIEQLYLLQYRNDVAPFKELGTGHFILTKPKENFNIPATGSYKFTVVKYTKE